MSGPKYDAERGGAIWNDRMSSDDGPFVASCMVQVLYERAQGTKHPNGWQEETIDRCYESASVMWFSVASNVLIEMLDDLKAQVAEAKARGEEVPSA